MHWIDWSILAGFVVAVFAVALYTKRYTRSVADFLAANRSAGKYLLAVASGIAGLGAITIVSYFQMFWRAGFTMVWYQMPTMAISVIAALAGWIVYRFRQTRALTMAQFFELRYSRGMRVTAGILFFVSGVINFAIFPSVGSRFFKYFCNLGDYPVHLGPFEVDLVYAAIMAALLLISLVCTFMGGQITVMVTDFLQGCFANVVLLILSIFMIVAVGWGAIGDSLLTVPPEGASMVNPLHAWDVKNYNPTFFLVMFFLCWVNYFSWQGQQAYNSSARTAHHQKMGLVLGTLRAWILIPLMICLVVGAFAYMHHSDFAQDRAGAEARLASIDNEQVRHQMLVPIALSHMLPIGLAGVLAAVMFAAFVTTHDTYLHSWGSIFIQDVVMPIRQSLLRRDKPMSPHAHIWWLRLSIVGVAIFIFLFSLLFYQRLDITMFFILSSMLATTWIGALQIGGLYWKRGTTAAAWAATIVGIVCSAVTFFLTQMWQGFTVGFIERHLPTLHDYIVRQHPKWLTDGPITPQIALFFSVLLCMFVFAAVSLLTSKGKGFDLDRLLHRGQYRRDPDEGASEAGRVQWWKRLSMGKEYKLDDKIITVSCYVFTFGSLLLFLVGTPLMAWKDPSNGWWLGFWKYYTVFVLVVTAVVVLWLTIGGVIDLKDLFARLRVAKRNERDDGTVVDHRNLDEAEEE